MDDGQRYEQHLKDAEQRHESLCRRCGACCGLFENDPCVKLVVDDNGHAACPDYENRFGIQKTVHGNEFNCVPFRRIVFGSWAGLWKCGYKRPDAGCWGQGSEKPELNSEPRTLNPEPEK
jgi:hypothetical protein